LVLIGPTFLKKIIVPKKNILRSSILTKNSKNRQGGIVVDKKTTDLTEGEKTFIRLMATALYRRKMRIIEENGESIMIDNGITIPSSPKVNK
jgi:hypothetical protein